jgi:hypothetical protein
LEKLEEAEEVQLLGVVINGADIAIDDALTAVEDDDDDPPSGLSVDPPPTAEASPAAPVPVGATNLDYF